MDKKLIDQVLWEIKEELIKANKKHGEYFNSDLEGYAVLLEEVEEMLDDIKANLLNYSCLEAVQVGAMAVKCIVSSRIRFQKILDNAK